MAQCHYLPNQAFAGLYLLAVDICDSGLLPSPYEPSLRIPSLWNHRPSPCSYGSAHPAVNRNL